MKVIRHSHGETAVKDMDRGDISNLWYVAMSLSDQDPKASDMVLETWHLAHDLMENLRSMEGLLEALENLMEWEGGEPGSYNDLSDQERADEVWQDAFDAIAKAKGQPRKE